MMVAYSNSGGLRTHFDFFGAVFVMALMGWLIRWPYGVGPHVGGGGALAGSRCAEVKGGGHLEAGSEGHHFVLVPADHPLVDTDGVGGVRLGEPGPGGSPLQFECAGGLAETNRASDGCCCLIAHERTVRSSDFTARGHPPLQQDFCRVVSR